MKYFSCFSGIGGFELGIMSADKNTEFVGYSEIDKYAIKVYERQFRSETNNRRCLQEQTTENISKVSTDNQVGKMWGIENHGHNYGDITKINADELPDFDCLVGGFPCQAFSIAGKRKGFDDTRGTLFFDLARILRAKQPRLFVFENVKGLLSSRTTLTFDAIIDTLYTEVTENIWQTKYDNNWEMIADNLSVYLQKTGTTSGLLKNSKSLLDQSLQIIKKQNFLVGDETQPFELKENVWDSLQKLSCSIDNSNTTDTQWLDEMVDTNAETVSCLKNILEGVLVVKKSSTTSTGENVTTDLRTCIYALQNQNITLFILKQYILSGSLWKKILSSSKKENTYYVKTFNVIINTITELGYDCQWQVLNSKNHGVPQNRERVIIVGHLRGTSRPQIFPIRETNRTVNEGLEPKDTKGEVASTVRSRYGNGTGSHIIQLNQPTHSNDRVYATDGISPTLNTAQGCNRQPFISPVLTPDRLNKRQNGRRFKEDGEPSFTLNTQDRHGIYDGMKIRRLTPVECMRLQGFPDNWCDYGSDGIPISDSQKYKMAGNAVTTNVIRDVFERIFYDVYSTQ